MSSKTITSSWKHNQFLSSVTPVLLHVPSAFLWISNRVSPELIKQQNFSSAAVYRCSRIEESPGMHRNCTEGDEELSLHECFYSRGGASISSTKSSALLKQIRFGCCWFCLQLSMLSLLNPFPHLQIGFPGQKYCEWIGIWVPRALRLTGNNAFVFQRS